MENKIKLLIVDDEVDFLDTIARRMEMRDFEVTKASSGREAIDAAKTRKFDIALLDLKMPGLDGFQVLDMLKKEHKYIEIIILTAHGSIEAAFDTTKKGAFTFLTKPYDMEHLVATIKDAYAERLKKKFAHNKENLAMIQEKIKMMSPHVESPLDIISELRLLDDEEK